MSSNTNAFVLRLKTIDCSREWECFSGRDDRAVDCQELIDDRAVDNPELLAYDKPTIFCRHIPFQWPEQTTNVSPSQDENFVFMGEGYSRDSVFIHDYDPFMGEGYSRDPDDTWSILSFLTSGIGRKRHCSNCLDTQDSASKRRMIDPNDNNNTNNHSNVLQTRALMDHSNYTTRAGNLALPPDWASSSSPKPCRSPERIGSPSPCSPQDDQREMFEDFEDFSSDCMGEPCQRCVKCYGNETMARVSANKHLRSDAQLMELYNDTFDSKKEPSSTIPLPPPPPPPPFLSPPLPRNVPNHVPNTAQQQQSRAPVSIPAPDYAASSKAPGCSRRGGGARHAASATKASPGKARVLSSRAGMSSRAGHATGGKGRGMGKGKGKKATPLPDHDLEKKLALKRLKADKEKKRRDKSKAQLEEVKAFLDSMFPNDMPQKKSQQKVVDYLTGILATVCLLNRRNHAWLRRL